MMYEPKVIGMHGVRFDLAKSINKIFKSFPTDKSVSVLETFKVEQIPYGLVARASAGAYISGTPLGISTTLYANWSVESGIQAGLTEGPVFSTNPPIRNSGFDVGFGIGYRFRYDSFFELFQNEQNSWQPYPISTTYDSSLLDWNQDYSYTDDGYSCSW